jgi:ribose 5-phosphate isomerase A
MDFKKLAAKEAVKLIKNNSVIGFGAGTTIRYAIEFLHEQIHSGFKVKVVTSSFSTKLLCMEKNLMIEDHSQLSEIDLYFDGCDQFDKDLNALKSGGAIHTREKLLASMAKEFIIIGDDSKYVEKLDGRYPIVIDVLPDALFFVLKRIREMFPDANAEIRRGDKKDGAVITENGNVILDIFLRNLENVKAIDVSLKSIPGVIETSLFIGLVSKAILGTKEGVKILN